MRLAGELVGFLVGRGWRYAVGAAGAAALVRGVEMVSHPAALCLGGAILLAIAVWPAFARRRAS